MKKKSTAKKKSKAIARPKRPRSQKSADPIVVSFLEELRRRRLEAEMTLEQLSERASLTPNYIGTVENGYRDPSLSTLMAIAQGLGAPLCELFGPRHELSDRGTEMARMFQNMSPEMQAAVLKVLLLLPTT